MTDTSEPVDATARRILFDTFWSPAGWKSEPYTTSPDDLAYATRAGYMFPSETLSHDECVARAQSAVRAVSLQTITDGFLASLTSRRLELRAALGSYAVARYLPNHSFVEGSEPRCTLCDAHTASENDWNILNFERYKWGGVRHLQPEYAAFDLERFSRLDIPAPTSEDVAVFRVILATARTTLATAWITALEKALGNVLKSNQSERRVLLEILGYCGILASPAHPGFASAFVPRRSREQRATAGDWNYPVCWWRGSDGVNDEALAMFFPQTCPEG
jgi:hypothetical protein